MKEKEQNKPRKRNVRVNPYKFQCRQLCGKAFVLYELSICFFSILFFQNRKA